MNHALTVTFDLSAVLACQGNGSSSSGRARSDPTHQHQKRPGPHLHSTSTHQSQGSGVVAVAAANAMPISPLSQYLPGPGGSSSVLMECESPGNQKGAPLYPSSTHHRQLHLLQAQQHQLFPAAAQQLQDAAQLRHAWSGGDIQPQERLSATYGHSQPQLHRHHSNPPSSESLDAAGPPHLRGSSRSVLAHSTLTHVTTAGQAVSARQLQPSSAPVMTIDLTSLHHTVGGANPGGATTAFAGVVSSSGVVGHHPSTLDATQTGSVNMQLTGFAEPPTAGSQFMCGGGTGGATPQQVMYMSPANFPYTTSTSTTATAANATLVSDSIVQGVPRTATERGEESPMVGVCIQQSPVASH